VRRTAPRPVGFALADVTKQLEPLTLIARVQRVWPDVAGELVAQEARPVAESAGTVRVACRSAVWAQELEMLAPDLQKRLNDALGASAELPFIKALKFSVESPNRRP
jgi:predicted nucleic acid-binding Zn ribbon protein